MPPITEESFFSCSVVPGNLKVGRSTVYRPAAWFDRMIETVEAVAKGRRLEVFVQTGVGGRIGPLGGRELVAPTEFQARYEWADLIVGHAGTGSILAALEVRPAS